MKLIESSMFKTTQSDKCTILATIVCIDTGRQTGSEGEEEHHDELRRVLTGATTNLGSCYLPEDKKSW